MELATGVAFVGVSWLALGSWAGPVGIILTVAYLYLAAVSLALALIDLDTHRLPDAIVLPSYGVALLLFSTACLLGVDWGVLLRALIGMAALYLFYLVLRLVRPGGMGGGDVKLAGLLGLYLGWVGWGALVVGAFAAFLLGGVFGVALMVSRRAGRRTAIPFGPWMLAGAWVGLLYGEPLAAWYLHATMGI